MITVSNARHSFPEPAGRTIKRPNGYGDEYTFLHFFNSVELLVGGKTITTNPHAVIIYDKKTPQYFYSETPLLHDWFHFYGNVKSVMDFTNIETDKIYYPKHTGFITAIVREMETEYFSSEKNKEKLTDIKAAELFIKLGRSLSGDAKSHIEKSVREKFAQLREKMFSHTEEKWPVSRMAQEVGFSQSRFYTLYKSIYKISPTGDLIGAKIERAKNILLSENESIDSVAEKLGYQNTTHFIRQFKSIVGVSPSVFRKTF